LFLLDEQEREKYFPNMPHRENRSECGLLSPSAHRTRAHKVRQNDCAAFEIARQVCASE
jgi:hypothetical protein